MILKKYIGLLLLCLLIAGTTVGDLTPAAEDRMQFEEATVLDFERHSVARKSVRKTTTKKNELNLTTEDLSGVAKASANKYGRAQGLMPLKNVSRPQGILSREGQILKKIFLKRGLTTSEAKKLTRQLYPSLSARKRLNGEQRVVLLARQQAFHDCIRAAINGSVIHAVNSRINEIETHRENLQCELKELGGYKTPQQLLFGPMTQLIKKEKKLLRAISKVKLEYQKATSLSASDDASPNPGLSFTMEKELYCEPTMLDYNEIKKAKGTKTADNVINRRQQSIYNIVDMNAWINDNHRIFRQKITDLQRELKPIQGALVDVRAEAKYQWTNSLATELYLTIKTLTENIASAKASVPAQCAYPNLGEAAWHAQPWVTCQTFEHAVRYNKIRRVDWVLDDLENYRIAHMIHHNHIGFDKSSALPLAGAGMSHIDTENISTFSITPFGPLQEHITRTHSGSFELVSCGPLKDLWCDAFRLLELNAFNEEFGGQPYRFGYLKPNKVTELIALFDF